MSYPPVIRHYEFPEPPDVVAVVNACQHGVACGIEVFELNEHPGAKVSFDELHALLLDDSDGRFPFAPSVDTFTIHWRFSGHARIVAAKLELFVRDRVLAVWSKALRWAELDRAAEGTTRFNGSLRVDYQAVASSTADVVITGPADGNATFPGDFLTAEHAPYKLKMSITEVEPHTRVTTKERWLYLDVVAGIDLAVAPRAWIAAGPAPPYSETRRIAANQTAYDALVALLDVNRSLTSDAAPVAATLPLPHDVFSRSSLEFYDNSLYHSSRELWTEDPLVPLLATLHIVRADGAAATAAQSAPILGRLAVYWDWASGERPHHPNEKAEAFVAAAMQYRRTVWPHAAANCHADHGGKRGVDDVHFSATAALPAPANALTANAARPWSTFTMPVTDPVHAAAATAGVFLRPSRIAGDRYRPSVTLAYPLRARFDTADANALATALENAPRAESSTTLAVRRKVTIANHFKKTAPIDDVIDWAAMSRDYFEPAGVELTAPAAVTTVAQADYENAFTAIVGSLYAAVRLALTAANTQYTGGDYAVNFRTYTEYLQQVRARVNILRAGIHAPATNVDVLTGQAAHFAVPNAPSVMDLVIPDLATYNLGNTENAAKKLMKNVGITGEDSYKKKLAGWSQLVTDRICDDLIRRLAPNSTGISFFQFEFADNLWHEAPAGLASTTHATAACRDPGCATPHAVNYPPGWWSNAKQSQNRGCVCGLRANENAVILTVAPFRYMRGESDAFATNNLTVKQRLKITAAATFHASQELCVAHEIGHQLGMPHAGFFGATVIAATGGVNPGFHDADDTGCLMSYNIFQAANMHFCGFCVLRLAGWSAGPSDILNAGYNDDRDTIALAKKGASNAARVPARAAVWAPDAANCTICNAATAKGARHHCRLCGISVCAACSNQTMLVRRPLSADGPERVRTCNLCHGLGAAVPREGAIWRDDGSAYSCADCGNDFDDNRKRHHCRLCGGVRCDTCTPHRDNVRRPVKDEDPTNVRVCSRCYAAR